MLKGSNVRINVSRGAKPVPVPDVTGQPYANAESALRGQGFVVTRVDIQSDTAAQGVVVAEDPPAGTNVPKGSKITLSVSKGPAATQMPDVTQQARRSPRRSSRRRTSRRRLIVQPVTDPSQDGIVLSQDPVGGTAARTSEVVTITVGQLQNGVPGGDGSTTTNTTPPTPTPTPP